MYQIRPQSINFQAARGWGEVKVEAEGDKSDGQALVHSAIAQLLVLKLFGPPAPLTHLKCPKNPQRAFVHMMYIY